MIPLVTGEPRFELANRLCGDRITIGADIRQGCVHEIHWQIEGCAILKASAAHLARTLRGNSLAEGLEKYFCIHAFFRSRWCCITARADGRGL